MKEIEPPKDFLWGEMVDHPHRPGIEEEVFKERVYNIFQDIKPGDVVLDIGANVGSFAEATMISTSNQLEDSQINTTKIYSIEPYGPHFDYLIKNMEKWGSNVHCSKIALSETREVLIDTCADKFIYQPNGGITFEQYMEILNIGVVDFMKMDVEGYEYGIINPNNFRYVYSKVRHIAAEFHMITEKHKADFARFREGVLKYTPNFELRSLDGVDIKWDLFNQHFLDYYKIIYIYITNEI